MQISYGYEKRNHPRVKWIVLIAVAVIVAGFLVFYAQMNSKAYDPCGSPFDYNLNGTAGDPQDKSLCLRKYYYGREVVPEKPARPVFRWWFW